MKWRSLTIMVIPETGSRTRRFQLPNIVIAVATTFIVSLLVLVGMAIHTNVALVQRIRELEPLQGVARQQRAEIDKLIVKATEVQVQLDQLHAVEANIRQITAANAEMLTPQSRTILEERSTPVLTGRGGARTPLEQDHRRPTSILSSFMPDEITRVIFGTRANSDQVLSQLVKPETYVTQARETITRMASQLQISEDLRIRLREHEKTVESHLEHLANRPIGMPVTGGQLTDRFGLRYSPFGWGQQLHTGLDIAAPYWSPVSSTAPGNVVQAGWKSGGYGYTVTIDHAFGYQTMYAHLADWDVSVGDRVDRGQLIAWVGSTGASTGPHLHYEVHVDGNSEDPAKYVN